MQQFLKKKKLVCFYIRLHHSQTNFCCCCCCLSRVKNQDPHSKSKLKSARSAFSFRHLSDTTNCSNDSEKPVAKYYHREKNTRERDGKAATGENMNKTLYQGLTTKSVQLHFSYFRETSAINLLHPRKPVCLEILYTYGKILF